ncbi:MAG: HPr family phosphocarrier protein [Alphaproteobacteria bacterium]|nr:HPr family phosphocarrier protein [Alphaproteobacteria bacterium]
MNDAAAQGRPVVTRTCEILNKRGLHARAAAKFVKLAGQFAADTHVTKGGTTVSGLSIMGLMMLAAAPGCTVEVSAEGDDAAAAVEALAALIAAKFDEE